MPGKILKPKYLLTLSFFIVAGINTSRAQSPGGIPVNNTLWLRSDNGVTSGGGVVSLWQENSGANVTGNFNVQSLAGTTNVQTGPALIPAGVNFNPYLRFDGLTNSLSSMNNFLGTALVSNNNVTAFQVLNLHSGVVWLKWETDFTGTTARFGFENSAGRLRFDFPKAVPASAGQNVGVTNILDKHTLSTVYVNANSVNRLNGMDDNTIAIPGPGNFAAANTKIVIGNENLLNLPCRIDLAEIIVYSNTLSAAERNKIESYLAVKYGFTLNQLPANNNNYVSSSGLTTWDRALNSGYASDITGIGRDDATALIQKQSRSVNTSALVTLYNGIYPGGVFPTENANNVNGFTNNLSFLLTGDNGGTTTINQCALDGYAHRMQRTWKVSKTGTVSQVTVAVSQASVPATIKYLLVSTDPAFPLGSTTLQTLSLAGGVYYTDVSLNHNDYFTFAGDTLPLPQLQAPSVCRNTTGTATITNPVAGAVYNWYNMASGGVLVGTGTSISIPNLLNDTTLYVETVSAFGCILPLRIPITIKVITVATPQTNTLQPTCTSGTGTITVTAPTGPGYTYCINGGGCQAGLVFPGLAPGNYDITAVDGTGCVSQVFTVTINAQPPTPTAPLVNPPAPVCPGQSAVLSVSNPVTGEAYNWYPVASGGTALFTGISYTTPPLTAATSFYVEAVNVQACSSSRTRADIQIRTKLQSPVVSVLTVTDSSILFSWTTVPGATNYTVSADGVNYIVPSSGIGGTTHLRSGLLPNTSYTLFVLAIDSLAPCITSNAASATGKTLKRYEDVYVPSAFTPNGDAVNNTLRVFGDIKTYQFAVFNRYGQRLFFTSTLNAGWDGTYKGKDQPVGTYAWYVKAILSDGKTVDKTGTTVLIR